MPTPVARAQVQSLMRAGAQLVEVLPCAEYEDEHLPDAINIPLKQLDRESVRGLDPEAGGLPSDFGATRTTARRKAAQDPEVELLLRDREAGAASRPELGARDAGRRQRCIDARRKHLAAGARTQTAVTQAVASRSAARTQSGSGCPERPRLLR